MLIFYNIILAALLILASPLLFVKAIATKKYRHRLPGRLGFGLTRPEDEGLPRPHIWVQALSVGEVRSSVPLVQALRKTFPKGTILFSTTTMTGDRQAQTSLADVVDRFLAFPLDLPWTVNRFLDTQQPDIFVLVETDFWPNLLYTLRHRGVPTILVNGRMSDTSFRRYQRLGFFCRPMFRTFDLMAMQSRLDEQRFLDLGVDQQKTRVFGNLKFDSLCPAPVEGGGKGHPPLPWPEDATLLIAGSTHTGEDEMILDVFTRLRKERNDLVLLLAPRHPERAPAVLAVTQRFGCAARLRSEAGAADSPAPEVLILDTIGELADLYDRGVLAFVGGSLVDAGGHNPLEPAWHARPVLFGPHMEDFAEIAGDMLAAGAAEQCDSPDDLYNRMASLLNDRDRMKKMGEQGRKLVMRHQGVVARHIEAIANLLQAAQSK